MLPAQIKNTLLVCFYLILAYKSQGQQIVRERVYKVGPPQRVYDTSYLTKEGNVILNANYYANPGYQSVHILVKPNLDTIWVKNGPLLATGGTGIVQTLTGGFAYYGTKRHTNPPSSGSALERLDANGNLRWIKHYLTSLYDLGTNLLPAPDSGYFVAGMNMINGKARRFTIGRTDSLGNLKWRKSYEWINNDFLSDLQYTRNGNIAMYGAGGSPEHLKIVIVNQNGDSVLGRQIVIQGQNRSERVWSSACGFRPLADGGFLLVAETDTAIAGTFPRLGMVVKVDANLQRQWHYINRNVSNNVRFCKARELADSSVLVLGNTVQGVILTGTNQFFFYHFSKTGTLLNVYPFTSGIAPHISTSVLEALPDSSFVVGGWTATSPQTSSPVGFYLAKVRIPGLPPALPAPGIIMGTKPEMIVTKVGLGQSYPNPAQAEVLIPYNLPKNYCKASIIFREIATGREVMKYELENREDKLTVDVSQLRNGLYLYSLVVDEKPVATKKLAVVK